MKKTITCVAACLLALSFISCKKTSSDNSSSLLALLLDGELTERKSTYNSSGSLANYSEIVYMSKIDYLKSLKSTIKIDPMPASIMDALILGRKTVKTSSAVGGDGIWFTSDDTFLENTEFREISTTVYNYISYSNFTGTISGYKTYTFDNKRRVVGTVSYSGDGTDNEWFTDDDVKSGSTITVWTSDNQATTTSYNSSNVVLGYEDVMRSTASNIIMWTMYAADHTTVTTGFTYDYDTGTEDTSAVLISFGLLTSCNFNTLDSSSRITQTISYIEDGDDDTWYTGDEVPGSMIMGGPVRYDYTYNSQGYLDSVYQYTDTAGTDEYSHSTSTFE